MLIQIHSPAENTQDKSATLTTRFLSDLGCYVKVSKPETPLTGTEALKENAADGDAEEAAAEGRVGRPPAKKTNKSAKSKSEAAPPGKRKTSGLSRGEAIEAEGGEEERAASKMTKRKGQSEPGHVAGAKKKRFLGKKKNIVNEMLHFLSLGLKLLCICRAVGR
jgi:hypothetical protein